MKEITRYEVICCDDCEFANRADMYKDEQGSFVYYEDYKELLAAYNKLKKEHDELEQAYNDFTQDHAMRIG